MNMNYELTKEMTNAKIKAEAKIEITTILMEKLGDLFGTDSVGMVRTGSGKSFTNEIGVVVGKVNVNGEEVPLTITLNPTVKEFESRSTAKKTYTAFDFAEARQSYEDYMSSRSEKKEKAGSITKKIEVEEEF